MVGVVVLMALDMGGLPLERRLPDQVPKGVGDVEVRMGRVRNEPRLEGLQGADVVTSDGDGAIVYTVELPDDRCQYNQSDDSRHFTPIGVTIRDWSRDDIDAFDLSSVVLAGENKGSSADAIFQRCICNCNTSPS